MEDLIVAIDEAGFRKAMGCFATGVTVVTTEHEGERIGITVSAFCSLSLNPPLVLVCIEKSSRAHDLIAKAERFSVNILHEGQQDVSARFASRTENRFQDVSVRNGRLKVPLLEDALAAIECRLHASLPGGDHTIYIGEVVSAGIGDLRPLLYFRSEYRAISERGPDAEEAK